MESWQQTRPTPSHPVSRAVAGVSAVLDHVTEVSLWSMGAEEAGETLTALTRQAARLAELTLRVASHADTVGVGEEVAASSTASWWAHVTRQDRPVTARLMHLAQAFESDLFAPVRDGLGAGDVNVEQAQVILRAVEDLPDDLDPALHCEGRLVCWWRRPSTWHLGSCGSSARASSPRWLPMWRTRCWRGSSRRRNATPQPPPG